jgi:nicotinamidase-related amidase
MKKEALLIIDMLNDFVRLGAPLEVPDNRKIVRNIQQEVNSARAEGRPVIYVCDAHAPDDKEFSRFGWPAHAVQGRKALEIDDCAPPGDGGEEGRLLSVLRNGSDDIPGARILHQAHGPRHAYLHPVHGP